LSVRVGVQSQRVVEEASRRRHPPFVPADQPDTGIWNRISGGVLYAAGELAERLHLHFQPYRLACTGDRKRREDATGIGNRREA
jgi:hypothetical protein